MNKTPVAIIILLLLVLSSNATTPTPSKASLKGIYVFQMGGARQNTWGVQLTCGGQPVFVGGTDTRDQAVAGTMTFNGAGGVTGSFTQYGKFDQTASNATVSCVSGGNAVYEAPSSGSLTGSYTIQSNGKGALNITVTPSSGPVGTFTLALAGGCNSMGIYNTVMLTNFKADNSVANQGMARLQ
jgi:hypothetical protein